MNQIVTEGIVLSRIDYGEADRIVTILTPDEGKIRLMAKGVRKVKSKLAGGIELFSLSQITFIRGKKDLGTLVSARLTMHYGAIVGHIDRVQLGYELIKQLDKATEDEPERGYFELLQLSFEALNDPAVHCDLIRLWFSSQLLRLGGIEPNLATDTQGKRLLADQTYAFDFDNGAFECAEGGVFDANDIKFLRLLCSETSPALLAKVSGASHRVANIWPLVTTWQRQYIQ